MAELDLHAGRGATPIVIEVVLARLPGQMCGCEPTNLCDTCRGGRFDNLRGTAACRGEAWADRVARTVPRSQPWPVWNHKVAAIARRQVEDLARDEKLLALLAVECASWAARRWSTQPRA